MLGFFFIQWGVCTIFLGLFSSTAPSCGKGGLLEKKAWLVFWGNASWRTTISFGNLIWRQIRELWRVAYIVFYIIGCVHYVEYGQYIVCFYIACHCTTGSWSSWTTGIKRDYGDYTKRLLPELQQTFYEWVWTILFRGRANNGLWLAGASGTRDTTNTCSAKVYRVAYSEIFQLQFKRGIRCVAIEPLKHLRRQKKMCRVVSNIST